MSRIFLSHSSHNNAEALAVRDWLAAQGWNDVFLDIDPVRGLVAADRWQKALSSAIGRCRAVIFLLSPHWLQSKHCISELDLAMHVGAQCIGVIIDPELPFGQVPAGLGGERQVIDLTRGGEQITFTVNPPPERNARTVSFPADDLMALRSGLARLGLVGFETDSFPWPPANEPDRAPFRGLEALDVKDAGVFFGRDADLVRAREELIEMRGKGGRKLFVIQGASGSGKSSFLRAGLIPRLEREDQDFTVVPLVRPGAAALSGRTGLAAALEQVFGRLREPRPLGDLIAALDSDENALPPLLNALQVLAMSRLVGDAAPQVDRPPTILLAIDQAEELFTPDAGQEAAKLRQHLAAALMRGPDTIALLTIRSDRFSLLQNDTDLGALLAPFNLPPMPVTAYRDAILKPAERMTPPLAIDARLADALITDTAAEGADPLPLLAFTLERLYRSYGKMPDGLSLKHYESLGGIAGSIGAAVRETFSNPSHDPPIPAERREQGKLVMAAFVPGLVDINEENGEPVSRIAAESEIPAECRNVVQRLVNARLLVSSDGPTDQDGTPVPIYRVAHEALLRRWRWLKQVLAQRAGDVSTAQLIERQAEAWDRANRQTSWLDLRGIRLREASKLANREDFKRRLKGVAAAYLAACRAQERHGKLAIGSALAVVMLGVIGAGVVFFQQLADRERIVADRERISADRERVAARSQMVEEVAKRFIARPAAVLSEAAERALKPGEAFKECDACPEMVVLPAGEFIMGSPTTENNRDNDEGPQKTVTIGQMFAVGKYEVTFAEWEACVSIGGCNSNQAPRDRGWGKGTRPVINVSWSDAREYVEWLSFRTGKPYRLLSEAEWEYAARAGTKTAYSWGDEVGNGNANCDGCGSKWDNKQTAPVGSFQPNKFGLYDMHGNVWEWVQDCYKDSYNGAPTDGSPVSDVLDCTRVVRGGAWDYNTWYMRAADRGWCRSSDRDLDQGYRVARVLSPARTP